MISLFCNACYGYQAASIASLHLVGLTISPLALAGRAHQIFYLGRCGRCLCLGCCSALSGFDLRTVGCRLVVVTLGDPFPSPLPVWRCSSPRSSWEWLFPRAKFVSNFQLFGVIPFQLLIYILMLVIAFILLHKTKYGRRASPDLALPKKAANLSEYIPLA